MFDLFEQLCDINIHYHASLAQAHINLSGRVHKNLDRMPAPMVRCLWQLLTLLMCTCAQNASLKNGLRTHPALFMLRTCSVTDFGAIGDNHTDNTASFRAAAQLCSVMVVPQGTFVSGAFKLSSHQRLEINAGATIVAVQYKYASPSFEHAYPSAPVVCGMSGTSLSP